MSKTYEVIFGLDALPGVFAIGSIRRGQSHQAEAAEAVRLVDVKGLAFASADDERAARQEAAGEPTPVTPPPLPASAATTEEH